MGRLAGMMLAGAITLALAEPVIAGTSLLGPGFTNWFNSCGGGRTMNIAIRHVDGTMTRFSLGPGEHERGPVQRGDRVAWRCDRPVERAAAFYYIVTVP